MIQVTRIVEENFRRNGIRYATGMFRERSNALQRIIRPTRSSSASYAGAIHTWHSLSIFVERIAAIYSPLIQTHAGWALTLPQHPAVQRKSVLGNRIPVIALHVSTSALAHGTALGIGQGHRSA